MPKDPMLALRGARTIDTPGRPSGFPVNGGMDRASRATSAEVEGGRTASARIFPQRMDGKLDTGAGMRDIELPDDTPRRQISKPIGRKPVSRSVGGRR